MKNSLNLPLSVFVCRDSLYHKLGLPENFNHRNGQGCCARVQTWIQSFVDLWDSGWLILELFSDSWCPCTWQCQGVSPSIFDILSNSMLYMFRFINEKTSNRLLLYDLKNLEKLEWLANLCRVCTLLPYRTVISNLKRCWVLQCSPKTSYITKTSSKLTDSRLYMNCGTCNRP